VNVEEFGESFYNKMLPEVIQECEAKGIVKLDKGARCIFL
jgi:arginyl-tRNA synthetase